MSVTGLAWLVLATLIYVTGSSILRGYVDNGRWFWLVGALTLFTIGNLVMVNIMRDAGLGLAIAISAVAQLIAAGLVAYLIFGERPTGMQLTGMALGIVAVALIAWPQGGKG